MRDLSDQLKHVLKLRAAGRSEVFAPIETDDLAIEQAYQIAKMTIRAGRGKIGGWKLGATTAATRNAFRTDTPYFGPLFNTEVFQGKTFARPTLSPLKGEAEIAYRLARDVRADDDLNDEALFDFAAPAIECPWSIVSNLPEAGLCALLMDRCAAGALLLGQMIPAEAIDANGLIEILIDGRGAASGTANTSMVMAPKVAAIAALKLIMKHGFKPQSGQWISTGGITPCIALPAEQSFALRFNQQVEFSIAAVEGR
jgi:2-keto-4-pentenoate hydratase